MLFVEARDPQLAQGARELAQKLGRRAFELARGLRKGMEPRGLGFLLRGLIRIIIRAISIVDFKPRALEKEGRGVYGV